MTGNYLDRGQFVKDLAGNHNFFIFVLVEVESHGRFSAEDQHDLIYTFKDYSGFSIKN